MQKVSKRQVLREASKLFEENGKLKKECRQLLQMLFGVAVKLYILNPDDESFGEGMFKPEFIDQIKKAAEATKNQPLKTEVIEEPVSPEAPQ